MPISNWALLCDFLIRGMQMSVYFRYDTNEQLKKQFHQSLCWSSQLTGVICRNRGDPEQPHLCKAHPSIPEGSPPNMPQPYQRECPHHQPPPALTPPQQYQTLGICDFPSELCEPSLSFLSPLGHSSLLERFPLGGNGYTAQIEEPWEISGLLALLSFSLHSGERSRTFSAWYFWGVHW